MPIKFSIAIATLITAASAAAFPLEDLRQSIPANATVRMGQGYNSLGGMQLSQDQSYCINRSTLTTFGGTLGERLSIFIDSIASSEEFMSTMVSSKSFGAGFSPTAAPEASGTHKFNLLSASIMANDKASMYRKYESKYTYAYVQIRKEFEPEVLGSYEISQNTLDYFSLRPEQFIAKCGDRFVSGIKKGAEVIGLLRCETRSAEEKSGVDRKIKANAGYKGFTAEGEVSELLEDVRRTTGDRCRMMVAAQGGPGTYDLRDSAAFIASAISYVGRSSLSEARPLEFLTTSYSALLNLDFSNNVLDKVDLNMNGQKDFVTRKRKDLDFSLSILENLSTFSPDDTAGKNLVTNKIQELSRQIETCALNLTDPSACRDPTSPVILPPGGLQLTPPRFRG